MGVPSSSSNWIIANVMEYGFYRVNYDQQNWNLIAQQLQTDLNVSTVVVNTS
jgi:aminopeptidase N